ncbi:MAG: hypothetical protein WA825_02565 [Steroidobacteraceae bacterium]
MFRLCVLVALFVSSCSTLNTESPTTSQPNQIATTIARIEQADPNAPAILSMRLSYAEFLLGTEQGPCQQRLGRAQEELDKVEATLQAHVMFPDGWARTADLAYRLHLARADCFADPERAAELRAAVAAAAHASDLYAATFDYHAAVIMHFNTAIILNQLGDTAAALTALQSTLAMDREYGFQDDAEENYRLLLTWQGQPADSAQVAALMQDFPKRQAILKFAWRPGDAHVSLHETRENLWDGAVSRSRAAASYERHIGADSTGGWMVSYTQDPGQYQPGVWPELEGSPAVKLVFSPARVAALNYKVSASGEFGGTIGADAVSEQLTAQTDALIRAHVPATNDAGELTKQALDTTDITLASGLLGAEAAENYQLETSMWAGATLDQGIWYRLSAPLSLHGLPRVVIQQRLDFAFTRRVPCAADVLEPSCVELVVRTTPDQGAVEGLINDYASSTVTCIVVDPATLLAYSREDRLYWYASVGKAHGDSILQSEHLKSTTTYNTR